MKILQIISTVLLAVILGLLSYSLFIKNKVKANLEKGLVLSFYTAASSGERKSAFQALKFFDMENQVVNEITAKFNSADPDKQSAAIAFLSVIGGNDNFNLIKGKLTSDNKKVATSALKALRQFPASHIKPTLIEIFKAGDKHKQLIVLNIIKTKKMKAAMKEIQDMEIKDEDVKKRAENIAESLGVKKKPVFNPYDQY